MNIHDYIPKLQKRISNFEKQLSRRERWGIINQHYDQQTAQLNGKIASLKLVVRDLCNII